MIAIFTIIFAESLGHVSGEHSHWDYSALSFLRTASGTMFQETVQQSATTIVAHANLVKRLCCRSRHFRWPRRFRHWQSIVWDRCPIGRRSGIRQQFSATVLGVTGVAVSADDVHARRGMVGCFAGVFYVTISQGITLLLMAWMYLTPIIFQDLVRRGFGRS